MEAPPRCVSVSASVGAACHWQAAPAASRLAHEEFASRRAMLQQELDDEQMRCVSRKKNKKE